MEGLIKKGLVILLGTWLVISSCVAAPKPSSTTRSPSPDQDYSRSRGKELGRAFVAEVLRQYQFVKDPEVTSLVTRIGREIVSAQGSDPTTYHFFVVKGAPPNAFAIPGGYIFIFDSLLARLRSPREVAGILAHEIAHVERAHFFKDEKKILAVDLATLAAILLSRGDPATITMAQAANIDIRLQYSQANESEADTYAVQYLRRAGYDPKGLFESFQTLAFYEQFNVPETPVYFSTHPGLIERQTHLELLLRQRQGLRPFRDLSVDWGRISIGLRAQLQPLKDIPALVRGLEGETGNPERQHYLTGVAYLKTGNFSQAVTAYQAAIALNPDSPIYHADLALCYFQLQKTEMSRSEAKKALRHHPDQAVALTVLGRLEEHEGRFQEAMAYYEKALRVLPADPLLHLYLGRSHGRVGDKTLQAYHLGRFLRLDLKPLQAVREFKRAQAVVAAESEIGMRIAQELAEIRRDGI